MKNRLIELKQRGGITALLPQHLPPDVLEVFLEFVDCIIAGQPRRMNNAHPDYHTWFWYVNTLWNEVQPEKYLAENSANLKILCKNLRREDFIRNEICGLESAWTVANIWTEDHPLAWEDLEKLKLYMNARIPPQPGPN